MNIDYQHSEMLTIQSKALAKALADKFDIGITIESSEMGFALTWTDFVANEWTEGYDNLSEVILRLAVLVRCGENNWEKGFIVTDSRRFAETASRFFSEQVA